MPGLMPKSSPVMMSHFTSVSPLRPLPPLSELLPLPAWAGRHGSRPGPAPRPGRRRGGGRADRLRAAELSPRPLDVCAVLLRRRAHLPGLADLPPEGFQKGPPVFVVLDQADGQLKPYGRPGREVLVFQERDVLLLIDGLSPELECAAPPVGDRRVRRGRVRRDGRPLR